MPLTLRELALLARSSGEEAFCAEIPPFVLVRKHKPRPTWGGETRAIVPRARTGEVEDELFVAPELLEAILPPLPTATETRELTVGRLEDNDIVLDEASVSLHHALLRWDAERKGVFVTDFTSTNGVSINGRPLEAAAGVPLGNGDILSLGDVHLRFFSAAALFEALRSLPVGAV